MRITSFPWQLHVSVTTTNSLRHFSSNLLTVARMEMKLGMHACYIISMTTSCFHDDHILFEQHQIASGTLHSSNLLTGVLMEMKLGTNAYDIVSMTTTYYLNNNKQAQAFTSSLLKLTNSSTLGTHAYYIISMTTTGIYLYYKFFIGGSSPFTEIYVVVYKNEWRQVI